MQRLCLFALALVLAVTAGVAAQDDRDDQQQAAGEQGTDTTGERDVTEAESDYVTREEFQQVKQQLDTLESQVDQMPGAPELSVTGNVSMTWGADLNTLGTGFLNEGVSTVKITILPATSRESLARGDVVGYISIQNFEINANSTDILGSTGNLTAGIQGPKWDSQIWTLEQLALSKARAIESGQSDIVMTHTRTGGFSYTYGGLDLVDVTANIGSSAQAAKNEANSYVAWAETDWNILNQLPANFRFEPGSRRAFVVQLLGAYQAELGNPGVYVDSQPFRSGDFAGSIQPVFILPDLSYGLVTSAAADIVSDFDPETGNRADPQMDFRFDIRQNLSETALIGFEEKRTYISAAAYYSLGDVTTSGDEDLDFEIKAEELQGGEGALESATGSLTYQLLNVVGDSMYWTADAMVDYTFGKFTPYVGGGFSSEDDLLSVNVGTKMRLLPRVTFVLDYASDAINSSDPDIADRGTLEVRTEISY